MYAWSKFHNPNPLSGDFLDYIILCEGYELDTLFFSRSQSTTAEGFGNCIDVVGMFGCLIKFFFKRFNVYKQLMVYGKVQSWREKKNWKLCERKNWQHL